MQQYAVHYIGLTLHPSVYLFCKLLLSLTDGFNYIRQCCNFYPTALFSPMVSGYVGGWREKVGPGCISETVRCRKLILGRGIGWGCRYATSCCDLDFTFDLAVVTFTYKILSGLYLRNHKV